MSTHTPGPWQVEMPIERRYYAAGDAAYIRKTGMEYNVASCSAFSENFEANARLIAAAPNMLAALQEAALASATLCARGHEVTCDCGGDIVRAAIAKATGSTS